MKLFSKLRHKLGSHKKVGLRVWLSFSLLAVVVVVVSVIAQKNMEILRQNKEKDVWAIVYLELEKMAGQISATIPTARLALSQDSRQRLVYRSDQKTNKLSWFSGPGPEQLSWDVLGFRDVAGARDAPEKVVLKLSGRPYLMSVNQRGDQPDLVSLISIENPTWSKVFANPKTDLNLYLLSRSGQVIAASDPQMADPSERPLVQKFILKPLSEGQIRFESEEGSTIGFFRELPGTNLVLFAEASLALMQQEIWSVYRELLIYSMMTILVGLFFLQWPLSKMLAPLGELQAATQKVAKGQFDLHFKKLGTGELKELTSAFLTMGRALMSRDQKIKKYVEDEKEAIRLKNEIAITSNIQQNFLPRKALDENETGVSIAARYFPAEEAAGDWYHYYFDARCQETVIALADVSGHGAGSAMFTAIIASAFERQKRHKEGSFPAEYLLEDVNHLIWNLGQGGWHATMMILVYSHVAKRLRLVNAGHRLPMVVGADKKIRVLKANGPALGMEPQVSHTAFSTSLNASDCLLSYTDGLVESQNPAGRSFSVRFLRKFLLENQDTTADEMAQMLEVYWQEFMDGTLPKDDTCFVTLKVAA